jgi:peptide-methionine (R)-S-oxide reductase
MNKIKKSEKEWRHIITPKQYHILREKGTELPFTGKYVDNKKPGIYRCAGCKNKLFSSATKYDSGTGWPSFYAPISKNNIETHPDTSMGINRVEVICTKCGGHLGHVFDDGPEPTGKRYCINSAALRFEEKKK